jgi:carbamate kinase
VICHGNGPQVGLLALQNEAYTAVKSYPLDVLDAQSQGMIGYLLQQEIGNELPHHQVATLLTQIIVDANDPAFAHPTKPIGPTYNQEQADELIVQRGWNVAPDGKYFRRVVSSPSPKEIVELETIKSLLKMGTMVVCGGGGGIPVTRQNDGKLKGIEAVIDKDNTASLIAEKLGADALLILTDVSAVCENWGKPNERRIKHAPANLMKQKDFAKGSMGPKIYASCRFTEHLPNKFAAIGNLSEVLEIVKGNAGTRISTTVDEISYY